MTDVLTYESPVVTRRTTGGYMWPALMVGAWIGFFGLLALSEPSLADLWERVRDLPLLAEGLVWLALFPLVLGLAVWNSDWQAWPRLLLIVGFAVGWSAAFFPRPIAIKWRVQ